MKRLNTKLGAVSVLFVLFILMQVLCAARANAIEGALPHAASINSPDGIGVTMKQVLSADQSLSADKKPGDLVKTSVNIGAMTREQLQTVHVAGAGASLQAYTAYATPSAGMCLPFRYVDGNWFLPDETSMASYAVIPESLSLTLFGMDRPAGNSINVGQVEFKICGVYHEAKGFLQDISGDGIPHVYLYNPLHMEALPVCVLYLADGNNSEVQILKQQAASTYKTFLDGRIVDYRQQIQLAYGFWYLSVLLCLLFVTVLLLAFAGVQLVRMHNEQKEPPVKRLKRLLAAVCIAGGALALMTLLLNQLRIPQTYLVQDNIFDVSFYMRSIVSFFRSLHTSDWANHFDWAFIVQLLALLFWAFCGIVFFVAGVLRLRHVIHVRSFQKPAKSNHVN